MVDWNRTVIMESRLGGIDRYQGRHIIHRDTPIDKGVYLGSHAREAIVVDSEKYPALKRLYQIAKSKVNDYTEEEILRTVYETTIEVFQNRGNGLEELLDHYNIEDDQKIALDVFIEYGIGVCRHMALTAGALLELFKKDGYIDGKMSIDRNTTELGGHAWIRYEKKDEVTIIDPALGYIGNLKNGLKIWPYNRSEDGI